MNRIAILLTLSLILSGCGLFTAGSGAPTHTDPPTFTSAPAETGSSAGQPDEIWVDFSRG